MEALHQAASVPRMLLYFFNSKEQLVTEALVHVRIREQLGFRRSLAKNEGSASGGAVSSRVEKVVVTKARKVHEAVF
jgi:hypothetical protein